MKVFRQSFDKQSQNVSNFRMFRLVIQSTPELKKKTIPREMTAILVIELSNIRPPCREHWLTYWK